MEDKHGYEILSIGRINDCGSRWHTLRDGNLLVKGYFLKSIEYKSTADDWVLKLDTSTKAYTKVSDVLRDNCAMKFSIVASAASSYGIEHNKTDLSGLAVFTASNLRNATLENQITDSEKILEVVGTYSTPLADAGISAAIITGITDDLADMRSATKVPQDMIDAHKNNKIMLVKHLDVAFKFYDKQFDKAMKIFLLSDDGIPFYLDYLACRKVRHHHMKRKLPPPDPTTGTLELLVLDKLTIEPFAGGMLEVKELNISIAVDPDGETFNAGIKPGTYSARLYCEGYKDLVFTFTIVSGKTCSMQFLMEKSA